MLHIMKKDAEGKLHEVLLSDGQPYLYQTVTSDANGDVLFPYLPRLEEGEAYVVFEQPDVARGQALGDVLARIPAESELGPHIHLSLARDGQWVDPASALPEA